MSKRPYSPAPDPNPLPVNTRAQMSRRADNGPQVSLPVVRWLERDIDEKQPRAAPQFDAGESFEEEATQEGEMDKTYLQRNFGKARMNKTGKYTRESKVTFTDDQFALISQAVKLSGKPFTEWARPLLLAAAEEQIREHRERELAAAE